jgi:hypothetical protein
VLRGEGLEVLVEVEEKVDDLAQGCISCVRRVVPAG